MTNSANIDGVHVAVALPVVQRIAFGGQSHRFVIFGQPLGVGEHQRAVEVHQRTHAESQNRMQAAEFALHFRAFGIGCGEKQDRLATIKQRCGQRNQIILFDLPLDGRFGIQQPVAPITDVQKQKGCTAHYASKYA